jgi:hypothetical protein
MAGKINFKTYAAADSDNDYTLDLEPFPAHAAKIDQDTLERWIDEGVAYLDKRPEESVYYTMSGDSVVLVTREDEGCDNYEVLILKPTMRGYTNR